MSDYYKQYINYKTQIDERLFSFFDKEQPKSLYEPLNYILSGGGKRIRPMILILSCEAFGGRFEDSVDAGIAIEILHNFTLVHDDIMDNADTRRGKDTIHKKWDTDTAILAGDELVGLAYKSLLKTKSDSIREIVNVFTEGIIEVCEGQSFDKEFELRHDVKLDEYIMMISKKTSKLLETCAGIGTLIGNGTEEQINIMKRFAENIGLAFQIQDDLLDIKANEKKFGKKIGGDLKEGKKTFLLINALEIVKDENDKRKLDSVIIKNGVETEDEIREIKKIYENYGVIDYAQKEVENYTRKANKYLKKIDDSNAKNMLVWFSKMLLDSSEGC
jgi:geranylgeranyl diphosphate synthase type II